MRTDPGGASPRLGVGMIYTIAADRFARTAGSLDYWAITPDMFWTDAGPASERAGAPGARFHDLPRWVEALAWAAPRVPIVAHHIGLSLGSTGPQDAGYVERMAEWAARWNYPWLSDHLSFAQVESADSAVGAGMALPLPYDEEVLDLVATRLAGAIAATRRPFLVENPARYIDYPDQQMSEPVFLNRLATRTGCGLLLDLHNLHCNARNLCFDAGAWLAELDLDAVVEIHIAGGAMIGDIYADSHAGPCPPEVWALLDEVVPRAPHLRGITFEFHDSWFHKLGDDGLADQIARARAAWQKRPQ
jgi:uncharacterized protein (UPF0276 family)